jgi:site-specific DNA recombinase
MRQPKDLETLLTLADQHKLSLYGQAGKRNLSDPDDRFILRIEVAHACRSSDDTSRRVLDGLAESRAAGHAHGGKRVFGYTAGMGKRVTAEAKIVKEVYRRFLSGTHSINAITGDLNERGILTGSGGRWITQRVRQMIDNPRYARLISHDGEIIKDADGAYVLGDWPAIITPGMWEEAQRMRQTRSMAYFDKKQGYRAYLLRGLVICAECGRGMCGDSNGAQSKGRPYYNYGCMWRNNPNVAKCKRKIEATRLEEFVCDAAKDLLTRLSVADMVDKPQTSATEEQKSAAHYKAKMEELRIMWTGDEITGEEYRKSRKELADKLAKLQRGTAVRPLIALEGIVIGKGAAAWFDGLEFERKAAVLRFLFTAIKI